MGLLQDHFARYRPLVAATALGAAAAVLDQIAAGCAAPGAGHHAGSVIMR